MESSLNNILGEYRHISIYSGKNNNGLYSLSNKYFFWKSVLCPPKPGQLRHESPIMNHEGQTDPRLGK